MYMILILGYKLEFRSNKYTPSQILLERLNLGLKLYQDLGPETLIIVSGGPIRSEKFNHKYLDQPEIPVSEARVMKEWLVGEGVDPRVIYEESDSINTHQNLLFSSGYLLKFYYNSINPGLPTFRPDHKASDLKVDQMILSNIESVYIVSSDFHKTRLEILINKIFGNTVLSRLIETRFCQTLNQVELERNQKIEEISLQRYVSKL